MIPNESPPLVAFQQLTVLRGNRVVLDRLDGSIPRSSITALIGLNGSGKTTLLRTMLGELPYRGEMSFRCGHDHSHPRPEHVGYVPQRLNMDARLPVTVRDLFGLAWNGMKPLMFGFRKGMDRRVRPLLDRVRAGHLLDVPIEGLSGGQLQRVLLALAIEPQPELLLLDEPAAGIDFQDHDDFHDLIVGWQRETQATVVLVSHDLATIRRCATRVLCLKNGRVGHAGPPAEFATDERMAELFGRVRPAFMH